MILIFTLIFDFMAVSIALIINRFYKPPNNDLSNASDKAIKDEFLKRYSEGRYKK